MTKYRVRLNMTRNDALLTMVSGITVGLLLCALPSSLGAEDDQRTQEEVAKACQKKLKDVHARMQRLESQGRYSMKIHDTMHAEFFPKMEAGKYREAEKVADRALALLKKGPLSQKPNGLSESGRETIDVGLKVGEKIPEFELLDQTGKSEDFDSLKGPKGLLLVFHRSADW